jgi:hypothetical protein
LLLLFLLLLLLLLLLCCIAVFAVKVLRMVICCVGDVNGVEALARGGDTKRFYIDICMDMRIPVSEELKEN